MKIGLGTTVTDKITGFKGVAVGYVQYISGCNQYLVSPGVDEKGAYRESNWIDEQRLVTDASVAVITLDNGKTPGFDRAAPKR